MSISVNRSEEWRPASEFPDYEVSSMGRIRRATYAKIRNSTYGGRILIPSTITGYARYNLRNSEGAARKVLGHRVVAVAFIGTNASGMHINHKDGNKLNNSSENLEWVTPAENVRHAWSIGLAKAVRGENHGAAKLSDNDVSAIRRGLSLGIQGRILAKMFRVTESMISQIKLYKNRKES